MNKVRFGCYTALITLGVGLVGCSDDDEPRSEVDAGVDASSSGGEGGSGGDGDGGSGGGTGGSGTGGAATGGSGGALPEAGPDAPGDATGDADDLSDLPAPTGVIVAAATDFIGGTTEISTVDLATNAVIGNFSVSDTDAIPVASGERGFVLERSNGVLHILDESGESVHAIDLKEAPSSGDAGADAGDSGVDGGDAGPVAPAPVNPHDVVVVAPVGGAPMAYVSLYDADAVAVVDLTLGAVVARIDLSSFVAAGDADAHAEVDSGYYDVTTGRVYFTLHRLDLTTSIEETSYMPVCSDVKSLLVGIDPATNAVVDINGVAAGQAVELSLAGPADLAWDGESSRLLLVNNGCFEPADGGGGRARHGIEAVTLSSGAATVVYAPTNSDFLNRLIPLSEGEFVVESIEPEFFSTQHQTWTVGDATLGAILAGVPNFPVSDTAQSLLGITTPVGAMGNVTRYRIANGASVDLLGNVWTAEPGFVAGVVRVTQ